ncbi:hypothetical protein IV203_020919 [Nitzschia inconspicua]|uniref:Uncharacterized protein n=1 Tax=Nitzschia inconspicua TaxID=303405 RepID=A0A9K3PFI3_9STRA|nr:hypothetical protein IV203_020919 [Nitzschia inconspicua]
MVPVARISEIGLPRSASAKQYKLPDLRYRPSAVGGDSSGLIQVSLHQKRPSIGEYQTTCISKIYALNDKVLEAFESHNEKHLYSVAFYLGLKFVETALLEIPKHGYFYVQKFAQLRTKSSHDALRVTNQLQELVALQPDALSKEHAKLERLQFLATEQCERLSTYEAHRLQVQTELNLMQRREDIRLKSSKSTFRSTPTSSNNTSTASSFSDCDVGSTLLACGESISSVFCPTLSMPTSKTKEFPPIPSSLPQQQQRNSAVPPPLYPDPLGRSWTAPSALFPPSSPVLTGPVFNSHFPPSPKSPLLNQASLMDEDDEEDDIEPDMNVAHLLEDSAYMDERHARLEPQSTVYLEEDNKLPPSYNDIFKLYNRGGQQEVGVQSSSVRCSETSESQHHLRTKSDIDLERALYLSGLEVMTNARHPGRAGVIVSADDEDVDNEGGSKGGDERRDDAPPVYFHSDSGVGASFFSDDSSTIPPPPGAMPRQASPEVSVDVLRGCYHEDFDALRSNGRVVISHIPTYQGRISGSTNGCTVIAPLICIHHFHNDEVDKTMQMKKGEFVPDPELPDQVIVEVIDEEIPNILPAVRKNLGLQQDAFLIPSDAHESLMDQQYMCPEQFLTVCGGNILAKEHLGTLLDQLTKIGPKKIGATLFFHEHVIAILQLRQSPNTAWFDIIDSLPNRTTLRRRGEDEEDQLASLTSGGSVFGSQQVFPGSKFSGNSSSGILSEDEWGDVDGTEIQMQQFLVDSIPLPQNAVRIRCMDRESLRASLRWYACSVLTPENASYIDNYEWNENLPDFDPRVFQAFIWQEA